MKETSYHLFVFFGRFGAMRILLSYRTMINFDGAVTINLTLYILIIKASSNEPFQTEM